jgi:hypothetical protein
MSNYFNDETDRYIVQYLETEDVEEKNKIFDVHIRPAFEKLIENQIYVYGFFNIDEVEMLKMDCLANLYEQLPKYKSSKGTKGFSYFNVVAKNWFFQRSRESNKRRRLEGEIARDVDDSALDGDLSLSVCSHEDSIQEIEFWQQLFKEMEDWRPRMLKGPERKLLEAIIFLMKNAELVPIYNKKAVYMYLRELTGLNGKQVVMNLKKIRNMYVEWRSGYHDSDESEEQ